MEKQREKKNYSRGNERQRVKRYVRIDKGQKTASEL